MTRIKVLFDIYGLIGDNQYPRLLLIAFYFQTQSKVPVECNDSFPPLDVAILLTRDTEQSVLET